MQTVNEDEKCRTCGKTYGWHLEHKPMHPFNNGEAGATAFLSRRDQRGDKSAQRGSQVSQMSMPFDPVLRQALIDAGIITVEQLRTAEEKIRAVTAQFIAETSNGE